MMTQPIEPRRDEATEPLNVEVWHEGDIVHMRAQGTTTLADVKHMFTVCQRVCDEYGYALVCVDNRNAGKSTQEARKYQTDMLRKRIFPSHSAVHGGNMISRAAVILVMRAVELVTGTKVPFDLVDDEASARRILDGARERFRAQGIAKK